MRGVRRRGQPEASKSIVCNNRRALLTNESARAKLLEDMSAQISRRDIEHALREDLDPTELTEAVTAAARGLRYGSIEVVVHDARVVQIIRTEKRRIVK